MAICLRILRRFVLSFGSLLLAASCPFAQDATASGTSTAPAQKLLTDTEVKAQYQNCPSGWYSSPHPGKARFAQYPFLWVVTPEFAKRFAAEREAAIAEGTTAGHTAQEGTQAFALQGNAVEIADFKTQSFGALVVKMGAVVDAVQPNTYALKATASDAMQSAAQNIATTQILKTGSVAENDDYIRSAA